MRTTLGRIHSDRRPPGSRRAQTLLWFRTVGCLVTLACSLLAAPRASDAQPAAKVHRIGLLSAGGPLAARANVEVFQQGLRDLDYVEGQNMVIEYRYAEDKVERLPDLAAELVRLHVDIIVTSGTPETRAAKQATRTIPIIMAGIGSNPVETGLVTNLARPEENVTGVVAFGVELWEKRLALLREAVPRLSRLAVLFNPGNPGTVQGVREIKAVALAMGVTPQFLEVRDARAFEYAFATIAQEPPDALATIWDSLTLAHAQPIADFAVRSHLPTVAPLKAYVQAGSLMSYGASMLHHWRRMPYYVDKILKGTTPSDLPVERSMQLEIVINLKTAQALGLTIPPMLLFQADEVIR